MIFCEVIICINVINYYEGAVKIFISSFFLIAPTAFEDDIYVSCGQTSCEVCIQELNLTDYIYSYTIQVLVVICVSVILSSAD